MRERNYCSRECHYRSGASRLARRTGSEKPCKVCGKSFYVPRARLGAQYCSQACKGVDSRVRFACEECGVETYGFTNQTKRWCGRACASKARRNGDTLTCKHCQRPFYVEPGRLVSPVTGFCSRTCHNEWQGRFKTDHMCVICGASFRWSPSRTASGKYNVTYCSTACCHADPTRRERLVEMQAKLQRGRTTSAERLGYALLDAIGVAYLGQEPFKGKFTPDALIPEYGIVVQFDGDY